MSDTLPSITTTIQDSRAAQLAAQLAAAPDRNVAHRLIFDALEAAETRGETRAIAHAVGVAVKLLPSLISGEKGSITEFADELIAHTKTSLGHTSGV